MFLLEISAQLIAFFAWATFSMTLIVLLYSELRSNPLPLTPHSKHSVPLHGFVCKIGFIEMPCPHKSHPTEDFPRDLIIF